MWGGSKLLPWGLPSPHSLLETALAEGQALKQARAHTLRHWPSPQAPPGSGRGAALALGSRAPGIWGLHWGRRAARLPTALCLWPVPSAGLRRWPGPQQAECSLPSVSINVRPLGLSLSADPGDSKVLSRTAGFSLRAKVPAPGHHDVGI